MIEPEILFLVLTLAYVMGKGFVSVAHWTFNVITFRWLTRQHDKRVAESGIGVAPFGAQVAELPPGEFIPGVAEARADWEQRRKEMNLRRCPSCGPKAQAALNDIMKES